MGVYKMKMEIDFDLMEKKGYNAVAKKQSLDAFFVKYNIHKDDEGHYVGDSFEAFWGLIMALSERDWFMDCVTEWKWYNGDYRIDHNGEFPEEDLLPFYQEKRKAG